ncbi:MAG TPA: ATP-dependent Clp protease adaptor ClpS [Thermoguttaceae bacterium]|nr:ATP-dependent Clp protease adaptor ClpS [Thermoguttaceae bacterium]
MTDHAAIAVEEPLEQTVRRQLQRQDARPKRQPRFNVVLWNDEDHTYAYVIVMLMELFGYPPEKGFQLAETVDTQGRVILMTTTREHAELKRDQIHAYGKDGQIENCQGSMWATIEEVGKE